MTDKHIENVVKVVEQIRIAYNCYKKSNTGAEVFYMVRAEALAEAFGLSNDEFLDCKRFVEIENHMNDALMMPAECINTLNEYYERESDEKVYTVVEADLYDNDFEVKTFKSEKKAQEHFERRAKIGFDLDKREKDSYGNTFEECKEHGEAFFKDNDNHGDVYVWMTENKVIE